MKNFIHGKLIYGHSLRALRVSKADMKILNFFARGASRGKKKQGGGGRVHGATWDDETSNKRLGTPDNIYFNIFHTKHKKVYYSSHINAVLVKTL